ncbi:MAG TPA: hypothetical protein VF194_01950 [Ferrovibrio sp.]|uniref:hypothetical protein n=1 Tax=Ferrovibrio sp. TaxID=1917215 RepID=UPI002ED0AE4A
MVAGYLHADPGQSEQQRRQLRDRAAGRPIIGLAWRSANAEYGEYKSLQLKDFLPLLRQNAFWVDLQYGDTVAERADLLHVAPDVQFWHDPEIDPLLDIDAAASQVAALDLVITSSNTTAHLAGGLGVPTWLLLPAPGYGLLWYWFVEPTDSIFYPAVRCFRQARAGDWQAVISELEQAFRGWTQSHIHF